MESLKPKHPNPTGAKNTNLNPPQTTHPNIKRIHETGIQRAQDTGKQTANTSQQVSSWADRVRVTDSSTRFSLEKIPKQPQGGRLTIPEELMSENSSQWTRCLVGFFPGSRPPYHMVNSMAKRVWQHLGLEHTMTTGEGFYLFRLRDEEAVQEVLDRGPWMFGGKSLVLQQWHPHFKFDKNQITTIPVWLRLRGLPFPLWTKAGLSLVASMVGRPLSCDESTFSCKRLEYARVCVEVDAAHPFVHNFELEIPHSSDTVKVEVEYEWKPSRCKTCKVYGHCCKEVEPQTVAAEGIIPTAAALERPQVTTNEGQVSLTELDNLQNSNSHNPTDHTTELDKLPNSHNPTDHTATQPTKPSHLKNPNNQDTTTRHPTPDDQHTQIQLKDKQHGPTASKTKPQPRGGSNNFTTEGKMHAEVDASTVTKGKGQAQETLVGKKATKSHENSQGFLDCTNSKMDSLQSHSQGTICSASTSYTADPSSSMDADQEHNLSQQDRTNKEPPPAKKKKGGRKKREVRDL
ncbi:hypothetical protein DKX38_000156 [Salix brachista]|uniref:DUF4283 domain-containing protein n=1 Tax=Salix brachista TaxID=2182728 RepID=A0A5N5P0A8_9ROSI|nr:hypothetical protein DKX38_000156 [Salix brachista]